MSDGSGIPEHTSVSPSERRPIHWNLHRLRLFWAVARQGSYTRAARELAIAQPALSHQVKALEREVGSALFERHGRGIELTPAGRSLADTCGAVFHELAEGERALVELEAGARGSVDIAADTTSGIYVVPRALGAFHRQHPGIDLILHVENRDGVLRRLEERSCDLAVMADPPHQAGIDVLPFLFDRLVVIAAPDHPLARRREIALEAVAVEHFLLRERGSGTRTSTERLFARAGLTLQPAMELGSTGAIKQAVAAGLGISAVSSWAIELESRLGRLTVLDVVGFPIERRWSLVNLHARRLDPAAAACRAFLGSYTGPETPG